MNLLAQIEMEQKMAAPATIIILIVTAIASLVAFQRPAIRERWVFNPKAILADKQFERMFTSGFIHADWPHFIFNAFSFYNFGRDIEMIYGAKTLLVVYFVSIIGGSLLSLIIHRHHNYRALGASGGVCGIIFASIFLLPGSSINVFPLPFSIPAIIYAVIFLIGSFVGQRRQVDNVGHDAHLGGAIIGLLTATALYPQLVFAAPITFIVVIGVSLIIMSMILFDPLNFLFKRNEKPIFSEGGERGRRYKENRNRNDKTAEMDSLLEKVSRVGIKNLSAPQRKRLDQLSKDYTAENDLS